MVGRSKGAAKPLVLVWLFFLIFFPLMIKLGFWQLDRAEQKRALLAEQQQRASELPRDFIAAKTAGRFERLRVSGHYLDLHLLLDNRQNNGRVGYELLTLFIAGNGEPLLVNRGWLAAPKYRSEFPEVSLPPAASENVTLEGYFYWPDKQLTVLKSSVESGGQNIWRVQGLDWPAIEALFSQKFVTDKEFRLLSADVVGAEDVYWDYQMMNPAKHQGYALQWFSMSLALLLLACFTTYRLWPRASKQHQE
jgi:surfeit locus 1 family protein